MSEKVLKTMALRNISGEPDYITKTFQNIWDKLPNVKKVVSVLSGGLDSTTLTYLLAEFYGTENVNCLTFNYGQKQVLETIRAQFTCAELNINQKVLDISFLGEIVASVSANIQGTNIKMPTIREVLGDPSPPTTVPFRNGILSAIALAYAEANGCEAVFLGIQSNDSYSYPDTSEEFFAALNSAARLNRKHHIQLYTPFIRLDKTTEIAIGTMLNVDYRNTLTCYNPTPDGKSCSSCPSCAERIQGFKKNGLVDPLKYTIEINW